MERNVKGSRTFMLSSHVGRPLYIGPASYNFHCSSHTIFSNWLVDWGLKTNLFVLKELVSKMKVKQTQQEAGQVSSTMSCEFGCYSVREVNRES